MVRDRARRNAKPVRWILFGNNMKTTDQKYVYALTLLGAMLAASLSGCATKQPTTSTRYTGFLAFEGNQSSWPQAPSALTKVDFAVPAYLGLPSKSYRIIGLIVNEEPEIGGKGLPSWLWSDETRLANACNQAKAHGADAVLVTNDPTILRALNVQEGPGVKSSRLLTNYDGVIVAIKWGDRR
jgi:hypothetical protein